MTVSRWLILNSIAVVYIAALLTLFVIAYLT